MQYKYTDAQGGAMHMRALLMHNIHYRLSAITHMHVSSGYDEPHKRLGEAHIAGCTRTTEALLTLPTATLITRTAATALAFTLPLERATAGGTVRCRVSCAG